MTYVPTSVLSYWSIFVFKYTDVCVSTQATFGDVGMTSLGFKKYITLDELFGER